MRVKLVSGRWVKYPWSADIFDYSLRDTIKVNRWCRNTFGPEEVKWRVTDICYDFVNYEDAIMFQMAWNENT